MIYDAVKIIEW